MSDTAPMPDMEVEVDRAPAQNALAYAPISGPRGKLVGGGEVFFSHNVKAAVKARAAGKVPQVFLTSEVNRAQQSIGYNAIAAALTHEVIPVAHVAKRYARAGKLAAFVAFLLADDELRDALGAALDPHADTILDLLGAGDPQDPQDPQEQPDMEDPGE